MHYLTAYKILYLITYFVLKRSLSICHIIPGHFSRCPLIWGSISKTTNIFWNILGFTYWLQPKRKNDTKNFCLCLFARVTTTKVIFVFANSAVKQQHVLFANEPFLRKILVTCFSSHIPLYIEKIPRKNNVRF